MLLAMAIQESMSAQQASPTSNPLDEDAHTQAALEASLVHERRQRQASIEDLERALAMIAADTGSATETATLPMTEEELSEPAEPPPPAPASFLFDPAEAVMRRRLARGATLPLYIAKAGVLLRRRARSYRARAVADASLGRHPTSQVAAGDRTPSPTRARESRQRAAHERGSARAHWSVQRARRSPPRRTSARVHDSTGGCGRGGFFLRRCGRVGRRRRVGLVG